MVGALNIGRWLGHDNGVLQTVRKWRRELRATDSRLRDDYLRSNREPKLQIGGGWSGRAGWLNTDLESIPGAMQMDATRTFPFPDSTFAYVHCEHMIEHVDYADGTRLLHQAFRVMQPGGIIRVVTPDLAVLMGLHQQPHSPLQAQYLTYFCDAHLAGLSPRTPVAVINAMMRMWGHQFIYDEATLREQLQLAGFRDVVRHGLGESEHAALKGIENEGRYPPGLLDFESLALEGTKPL